MNQVLIECKNTILEELFKIRLIRWIMNSLLWLSKKIWHNDDL